MTSAPTCGPPVPSPPPPPPSPSPPYFPQQRVEGPEQLGHVFHLAVQVQGSVRVDHEATAFETQKPGCQALWPPGCRGQPNLTTCENHGRWDSAAPLSQHGHRLMLCLV